MSEEHVHGPDCDHDHDHEGHEGHEHAAAGNPFANLDQDTQAKIQELQMMEQGFQQLMMQKNSFTMESNETELVIAEVEKSEGEIMRIIGNQVAIKSTKEKILDEMKKKKELIDTRMETITSQEKEYTEKMDSIREEVMKTIQG